MKTVSIEDKKREDVRETLNSFVDKYPQVDRIIVLGLDKDYAQYLMTNKINGAERAFLLQFLQAYMNSWFKLDE